VKCGLLLVAVLAGCEDVPQPFELDHARVMAVRVEPPAVAAGQRARIDVLVTDGADGPRVAAADGFAVTAPGLAVARLADGWYVTAPTEAELSAARAALGLPAEADVIAGLELAVESAEGTLHAQKTLAFGRPAQNPAPPAILQDGAAGPIAMTVGRDVVLSPMPVDAAFSYRWFSSVGELIGYTRPEARLEPDQKRAGVVGVVVRDQAGGTAWTIIDVAVAP
jgi:hypothetical protein